MNQDQATVQISSQPHTTISAVIIRADGRREELGVIVGGTFRQKVAAFFRIKIINFKQWLRS